MRYKRSPRRSVYHTADIDIHDSSTLTPCGIHGERERLYCLLALVRWRFDCRFELTAAASSSSSSAPSASVSSSSLSSATSSGRSPSATITLVRWSLMSERTSLSCWRSAVVGPDDDVDADVVDDDGAVAAVNSTVDPSRLVNDARARTPAMV